MQVKDGHLMYGNDCYDGTQIVAFIHSLLLTSVGTGVYATYNPFPLVLLTNPSDGSQAIHIAPNAHEITSNLFSEDELKFWVDGLGKQLEEVGVSILDEI